MYFFRSCFVTAFILFSLSFFESLPVYAANNAPSSLREIKNHKEFLSISRSYKKGRFENIPHVMFLVDRKGEDVFFINSKKYDFHEDFAVDEGLLNTQNEEYKEYFERSYYYDNRPFIMGFLIDRGDQGYIIELWEGDKASPVIWQDCYDAIKSRVSLGPISIKPNSLLQERSLSKWKKSLTKAESSQIPTFTWRDLSNLREFEIVNPGICVGRLNIISKEDDIKNLKMDEIALLNRSPLSIFPVSGIITSHPGTILSHINILSKGWKIPNLYIKNAAKKLRKFDGKWVYLEAKRNDYSNEAAGKYKVRLASKKEIEKKKLEINKREGLKKVKLQLPEVDLTYRRLTDIKNQRAIDSNKFGSKAANLGEISQANIKDVIVPKGFSIPFIYYQEFVEKHNLKPKILKALSQEDLQLKQKLLKEIREYFISSEFDLNLADKILKKIHAEYQDVSLFVRGSSNAEDLPKFSGAGLYDTVPNVIYKKQGDRAVLKAIKKVWGSVWNAAAVQARENLGISGEGHLKVYSSILLQTGKMPDSAGVMITANPYKLNEKNVVYISATKGLGIKVVEGKSVPEQILYRRISNAIIVLTRTEDDNILAFNSNGGVKKVLSKKGAEVLTEKRIRKLVKVAQEIERLFSRENNLVSQVNNPQLAIIPNNKKKIENKKDVLKTQDIEWLMIADQIYIVQSRPFVE